MSRQFNLFTTVLLTLIASSATGQTLFPANNAKSINPDVQLKLTFPPPPTIGKSGKVRIYHSLNNRLVDTLDLSIPPGPTERATGAALTPPYLAAPYNYDRGKVPTTNVIPVVADHDVYGLELTFPFPRCEKAKQSQ